MASDKSECGMKRLALLACALVIATGCSKNADTKTPGGKTIGVSIQNREAQFYQDMESGMKAEAQKFGYTVNVVDASRDNSKQQSQVEDFISQKVAAIVLTPYDSQAIGSAIVEANKAASPCSRPISPTARARAWWSRTSPATTFKAGARPVSSCARPFRAAGRWRFSTSPK